MIDGTPYAKVCHSTICVDNQLWGVVKSMQYLNPVAGQAMYYLPRNLIPFGLRDAEWAAYNNEYKANAMALSSKNEEAKTLYALHG